MTGPTGGGDNGLVETVETGRLRKTVVARRSSSSVVVCTTLARTRAGDVQVRFHYRYSQTTSVGGFGCQGRWSKNRDGLRNGVSGSLFCRARGHFLVAP